MTNKEKYKQAFSVLHASENITLEENRNMKKSFRPPRKLGTVCVCAAMILALGVAAYAYGIEVSHRILGWGNNFEITQGFDENGENTTVPVLHTDNLTDPVVVTEGKMLFVVNDEKIDITSQISQSEAFRYEYTDDEGNTHFWFVGLNSDEMENYGYAEYIKDSAGEWAGGYSARVNIEADGSTSAQWLETAKSDLNIPW